MCHIGHTTFFLVSPNRSGIFFELPREAYKSLDSKIDPPSFSICMILPISILLVLYLVYLSNTQFSLKWQHTFKYSNPLVSSLDRLGGVQFFQVYKRLMKTEHPLYLNIASCWSQAQTVLVTHKERAKKEIVSTGILFLWVIKTQRICIVRQISYHSRPILNC